MRGGFFIAVLTDGETSAEYANRALVTHDAWEDRTGTLLSEAGNAVYGKTEQLKYMYTISRFFQEPPQILPGEFVVTGPYQHNYAKKRLGSSGREGTDRLIDHWEIFKENNKPYFVGTRYPEYYHGLFGSWVVGSTLALFEFPVRDVYYRENEDVTQTEKMHQYRTASHETALEKYLEALNPMDGWFMVGSRKGEPEAEILQALFDGYEDGA